MRWWYALKDRLWTLFRRGAEERALREEMRFHLEMEERKLRAKGMSAGEARRRARIAFGGEERMKERARGERGTRWLDETLADLRYALRGLRRSPGFALVAVSTLSVGIGATTAMYTLVDGVLLRPLPYPASERIIALWERTQEGDPLLASYLNFADWRAGSPEWSAMAAYVPTRGAAVLTPNGAVRARITAVSADFFEVGGVAPLLGRVPTPDEHAPGGPPVAVVSRSFWEGPLGRGDAAAGTSAGASFEGATVDLNGVVYDVIGVMPASFRLPDGPEVWTSLDRAVPWNVRGNHVVGVLGRLADGVPIERADAAVNGVHASLAAGHPEVETVGVLTRGYLDDVVGGSRRALGFLLAASGVLLLIACANVASTLLARGTARVRELGVRASLGASRGRLVRKLVLESVVLAVLGSALGVALGQGILSVTRALNPTALPRLAEVSLDGRVLVFTVATMAAAALAFGLLPALALTRRDLALSARAGRSGYDRATRRAWRAVMGAEAGLALALLIAGGVFAKSLTAVLERPGGFDADDVVVARIDLPTSKYEGYADGLRDLDELVRGAAALPGVERVGVTFALPLVGQGGVGGQLELGDGSRTERVFGYGVADAGYFEALDIPLLRGRLFEPSDGPDAPHVALVDAAMAEALWPGEDPIGRTFNPGGMDAWPDEGLTVIGVVGETLSWDTGAGERPSYYVHLLQRPLFPALFGAGVVVETADVGAVAGRLREVVHGVDRDISVRVESMWGLIRGTAADRRLNAFVLAVFAGSALLLAAMGVYGVVAYAVARRTREMGIRLALGAQASQVRSSVQRDVLVTVGVGSALGLVAVLALQGTMRGLLFGVSPSDPSTLAASVVGLGVVAWVASWIPAWRGTRLDPADVLRYD